MENRGPHRRDRMVAARPAQYLPLSAQSRSDHPLCPTRVGKPGDSQNPRAQVSASPVNESIGRGGHPRLLYAALMLGSISQALAFSAFVSALPQMALDLGARGEFISQMMLSLAALG